MKSKSIEELLTDFKERYNSSPVTISVEKRLIKDKHYMLWFKVNALIKVKESNQSLPHDMEHDIKIQGESYTLDNAIGELVKNANRYTTPKLWPRREKSSLPDFPDMKNIVTYIEKPKT